MAQIHRLEEVGCEIIRCTVPTEEAACALKEIKRQISIPLVADIHFNYRLAIAAIENGADKIRINPGNIGGRDRVEGQIRGIRSMVEEERYCVDILTQVQAVSSALNAFSKTLLSNHIKTCVVEDIRDGKEDSVDELCKTIQKLMK